MKDSHTRTPRSLGDCYFKGSADPIERPTRKPIDPDTVVFWACVAAAIFVVGILVKGL